ncbi:MAG: U32 family peptidase, partial [Lachnospiraceae bacterium]|nr:U32 family peptidase [Lachnospiraceae bacterium]
MNNKTVELLAPAGDFACFMAAINAGADAVYLGGMKFGARAYAGNFLQEEIVEALRVAHLFGRKIYLTVNTLVKEAEMPELVPYIEPLYKAGLDGVIVQDIGVLETLREQFPELSLHASTQMTVTGVYGAEFVKSLGVCRVVPARELSLDEITDIKQQTGLEIECFIHGAMCYAYSGQCLFSSILGGRSGNRGRCAGTCRLPYTDENGKQLYPLSLKDMYTLSMIPKLIAAGIDSFKIEGRMKSPEYVAGVTAVYRKYIDRYLSEPDTKFQVAAEDEALLRGLYIRSDLCHGYYEAHNGKDMITIKEPGYGGSSNEVLEEIRKTYLEQKPVIPVKGTAFIYAGKPATLTLYTDALSVTVEGDVAGEAINRPLTEKEISDRLSKLGDTYFKPKTLTVHTDQRSFMAVKALNELRRKACTALEKEILGRDTKHVLPDLCVRTKRARTNGCAKKNQLAVLVSTREQLAEILLFDKINMVYI